MCGKNQFESSVVSSVLLAITWGRSRCRMRRNPLCAVEVCDLQLPGPLWVTSSLLVTPNPIHLRLEGSPGHLQNPRFWNTEPLVLFESASFETTMQKSALAHCLRALDEPVMALSKRLAWELHNFARKDDHGRSYCNVCLKMCDSTWFDMSFSTVFIPFPFLSNCSYNH